MSILNMKTSKPLLSPFERREGHNQIIEATLGAGMSYIAQSIRPHSDGSKKPSRWLIARAIKKIILKGKMFFQDYLESTNSQYDPF